MKEELNIDKLLDVFLEGIYAMDPKTALPFWDYDFAPLFGDLWIKKILKAVALCKEKNIPAKKISQCFQNIAVPRKEIIYSLADLKMVELTKEERLAYLYFWWQVVLDMAKSDPLVERSNIIHDQNEIDDILRRTIWEEADRDKARQVGNLSMLLNSLAYGLYTDIFAHNSMENFGPYNVSKYFCGEKHILVIKQWANLKPIELFPELNNFLYNKINILAIYKEIDYTVDIYTHQIYHGNAADNLVQYAVVADGKIVNNLGELKKLNDYLGPIVTNHFQNIKERGFEEAKKAWVLARNYQFKNFFALVNMDWYDQEMLDRVKDMSLEQTDYWDFEKYSKNVLFSFWRKAFDPRLNTYYQNWGDILKDESRKNA